MSMRKKRRALNFTSHPMFVWLDMKGKHGPDIIGCTGTTRRVRIKHYVSGFRFGGKKYKIQLFKTRGLPKNWLAIAKESDFEPLEQYPGVWDIFDKDVGDRSHNFHRNKHRAWITCYHDAIRYASDEEGWML